MGGVPHRPKQYGTGTEDILVCKASKLVPMGFISATEYHERRRDLVTISTGSSELDKLLGGN